MNFETLSSIAMLGAFIWASSAPPGALLRIEGLRPSNSPTRYLARCFATLVRNGTMDRSLFGS